MRETLMVEAMCWDLAENVTADYAYANRESFSFFCPHSCCLQEVRPKHRNNTYFFAPKSHVPGCPNEARKPENEDTTSSPAKKPSVVPLPAVPTELGPPKNSAGKRERPTKADLLALSRALAGQPPRSAGTLPEVVYAWQHMSEHQRRNTPLCINKEQLTYESAFYCVSKLGDNPIERLPSIARIVYGAVRIEKADDCYWLKSIKKYKASATEHLHLLVRVQKSDCLAAEYLAGLMATSQAAKLFTLFYFGMVPKRSRSGKSYGIPSDITNDYKRFVVLPEC